MKRTTNSSATSVFVCRVPGRRTPGLVPGDVQSAMEALGLEIIRIDDDEIIARCPAHEAILGKPDRNPSFSVNAETGLFGCWSCKYGGSWITLVADMRTGDYAEAEAWTREQGTIGATIRTLEKIGQRAPEGPQPISRASLALFTPPPAEELHRRLLSPAMAAKYGVLWKPSQSAWILPMYHPDSGALIGWQEKTRSRVRNYPEGNAKRNLTVFGVDQPATDVTVVVESPLDAARVAQIEPGAVALFGSGISAEQVAILAARSSKVIIFMDDDKPGWIAARKLAGALRGRGVVTLVVTYDGLIAGGDPGDMSDRDISHGLETALPTFLMRWPC